MSISKSKAEAEAAAKSIDALKLEYEDRRDKRKWIKDMFQMLLVFVIGAGSGSGITALTMGDNKVEMRAQDVESDGVLDVPDRFVPLMLPGDSGFMEPEVEAMLKAGEEPSDMVGDLETLELMEPELFADTAHE